MTLRKLVTDVRDWIGKMAMRSEPGIHVSPKSKVAFRNIHLKKGSEVHVGQGSIVEGAIFIDRQGATVTIGERVFIGGGTRLVSAGRIDIGDDVMVSWGCTIVDHNSHSTRWEDRKDDVINWSRGEKDWSNVLCKPVTIAPKAWLGFNVVVLKGVTVGEGSVVGAGSVVTKDVPPWHIVAGNPARIVREISHDGH